MTDLFKYQDLKYRAFHSNLLNNSNINLIGIRVPILKDIAKSMINDDYITFFNEKHTYYEEYMIHGLIIGYLKVPFKDVLHYLDMFIPYVDNWAVNDTVCANLKSFNKNLDDGFIYIKKLLESNEEFIVRFGLVLLLDYYVIDNYIDKVLDICLNTKSDKYYINMANSWLISKCYIKYPNKTIKLIKNKKLDTWVKNKSISKICDSYSVKQEDKDVLKALRS